MQVSCTGRAPQFAAKSSAPKSTAKVLRQTSSIHGQFSSRLAIRPAKQTRRIRSQNANRVQAVISTIVATEGDRDQEKEASRKYKRTVFTLDNWANHRSTKRYRRHVLSIFDSRIVRGLLYPLATVTTVATFIAVWETLREKGLLFEGAPQVSIEAPAPLSLTSFALSLLLVFRTNTSYGRWNEARVIWGGITNRSRDIVRQSLTFVPGDEPELAAMFRRWAAAYSKSLMCHLRDDHDPAVELKDTLPPNELEQFLASKHRPNYVLQVLSELVESSCIISPERFRMDQNLTFLHDCHGACERLLKTPIPLSYTRHTSRFLVIWLALMPFTLWKTCHWAIIPVSSVIAFLLLGIEEIGVQIEEPFGILPLEAICETIDGNTKELVEVNGGVRKMVGQVNKASSARDKYFEMGNGNGVGGNGKRETQFFPTPDIPSTNPR